MYYIYLNSRLEINHPKYLIIFYDGTYFQRSIHSDWYLMDEQDISELLSGSNLHYYSIEKEQFEQILDSWGGSRYGYRTLNKYDLHNNEGYGNSYDENE